MKILRVAGVLFLCGIAPGFGQANDAAFFRISSPSNAVIAGFDPLAGTLACSNTVAGTTNQLQRTYDLVGTSNWVNFVQLVSNTSVITETIIDLDPPEGMAFIPGGSFQMGDSFGEDYSNEQPVHSVYVSPFYMGKYEVTKALWDEIHSWATSHGYIFDHEGFGKADSHPVHTVNWYDCVKWCNARSEMEGRTPCYNISDWSCDFSANGYRLPTEAEWEKAARGGLNGKRFEWGDLIAHGNANYYGSSNYVYDVSSTQKYHPAYNDGVKPYTNPEGSFAPNAYGLYDMAGNIREWCWDWYEGSYYETSPWSNPRGASTGLSRIERGGGWNSYARDCRLVRRAAVTPSFATNNKGFRVVLPTN